MHADIPDDAACRKCGYSLRALSEPRCPECGRTFVPGKPRTYFLVSNLKRGFPYGLFVLFTFLHFALATTTLLIFREPIQSALRSWWPIPLRIRAMMFTVDTLFQPFIAIWSRWGSPQTDGGILVIYLGLNSCLWGFCIACIPWMLRKRRLRKYVRG